MPNRYAPSWNIWQHATLRSMAAEGKSAREISPIIGKTRNAIIGMCRRQGIQLTAKGGIKSGIRVIHVKPEAPQIAKEAVSMEKPLITLPPIVQNAPKPIYENPVSRSGGNVILFERTSEQCPYVLGEPRNMLVCGQPVAEGCVYCQAHHLACHTEPKVRQAS